MNLRQPRRAAALAIALARCAFRYWFLSLRGPLPLEKRALWLQSAARGVLDSLDIRVSVEGALPGYGLVVSNHLSYLDIVIFAAVAPCFFVAKREVKRWPFFGSAALAGGTIFLDRSSLASANAAADEIAARLTLSIPVLLFPEGTSSDGSTVLPFHSRLFLPAVQQAAPVTAAAIRYIPECGVEERELCWYGDAGFPGHLWKVLGSAGFSVQLRFGALCLYSDARYAAAQARSEITSMRTEGRPAHSSRLGPCDTQPSGCITAY
jgi:1-acyl-sn-glycerol-3-phosphate acyltransferase